MTTPSEPSLVQLWLHGGLDLSEQLQKEPPECPAENVSAHPTPRRDRTLVEQGVHRSLRLYNVLAGLLCVVLSALMLLTAADLPPYGSDTAPTVNEVARRYVEQGTEETGAVNTVAGMRVLWSDESPCVPIQQLSENGRHPPGSVSFVPPVAGMILDYRAFDTLGESFVLFTAMCAVTILLNRSGKKRWLRQPDVVDYASDPIVAPMCRFLIPVILVFGIYILLNGHLSPGGGFSGGSILAAGLMLFAMVWGDGAASAVLRPRRLQTVVLCSLGFYCLAKSYSFYTGANHLHSIISPGTPGRILSAGLILPLNVAVGFVVCCTMYSFYMYFRRGEL